MYTGHHDGPWGAPSRAQPNAQPNALDDWRATQSTRAPVAYARTQAQAMPTVQAYAPRADFSGFAGTGDHSQIRLGPSVPPGPHMSGRAPRHAVAPSYAAPPQLAYQRSGLGRDWVSSLMSLSIGGLLVLALVAGASWWVDRQSGFSTPEAIGSHTMHGLDRQLALQPGESVQSLLDTSAMLTRTQFAVLTDRRLVLTGGEEVQSLALADISRVSRNQGNLFGHQVSVSSKTGQGIVVDFGPMRDGDSARLVDTLRAEQTKAEYLAQKAAAAAAPVDAKDEEVTGQPAAEASEAVPAKGAEAESSKVRARRRAPRQPTRTRGQRRKGDSDTRETSPPSGQRRRFSGYNDRLDAEFDRL